MLNNKTYNLMVQLVQEHKSLWRIRNHYLNECEGDTDCEKFWKKMEDDKESHINELLTLIKRDLGNTD